MTSSKVAQVVELCQQLDTIDENLRPTALSRIKSELENKKRKTLREKNGIKSTTSNDDSKRLSTAEIKQFLRIKLLSDRITISKKKFSKIQSIIEHYAKPESIISQADLLLSSVNHDVFNHTCSYLSIKYVLRLCSCSRKYLLTIDHFSFWQKYPHNKCLRIAYKQVHSICENQSQLYCYSNCNLRELRFKPLTLHASRNLDGYIGNELECNENNRCVIFKLINQTKWVSNYKNIFNNLETISVPNDIPCILTHIPMEWVFGKNETETKSDAVACGDKKKENVYSKAKNGNRNGNGNGNANTKSKHFGNWNRSKTSNNSMNSMKDMNDMVMKKRNSRNNNMLSGITRYNDNGDLSELIFTSFCEKFHEFYKKRFSNIDDMYNNLSQLRPLQFVNHEYNFNSNLSKYLLMLHGIYCEVFLKIGYYLKFSTLYQINSIDKFLRVFHKNVTKMHLVCCEMVYCQTDSILTYFFDKKMTDMIQNRIEYFKLNEMIEKQYKKRMPQIQYLELLFILNNQHAQCNQAFETFMKFFDAKYKILLLLNWCNSLKSVKLRVNVYNLNDNMNLWDVIHYNKLIKVFDLIFENFNRLNKIEISISLVHVNNKKECLETFSKFYQTIVRNYYFFQDKHKISKLQQLLINYQLVPNAICEKNYICNSQSETNFHKYNKFMANLTENKEQILSAVDEKYKEIAHWLDCRKGNTFGGVKTRFHQKFEFESRI